MTSPVNVVTNALFLILWNCIASRITMGRIVSNSQSNMIGNVVVLDLIFLWLWQCTDYFATFLSGHLE